MAGVQSRDHIDVEAAERRPTVENAPNIRAMYEQQAAFVCRSLRRLGVAEADLDDALQEVFLVAYQRFSTYQECGKVRSWLYSICTRTAYAQRRKRDRRREQLSAEPEGALMAPPQLLLVEQRQALDLGQRLLERLSPEQREVFVLYEVEEMSMVEVAEALGCPLQTAYSRLHKARAVILSSLHRAKLRQEVS
jgi:RNA polymerase sigma-70 factor (ECF subfamily)